MDAEPARSIAIGDSTIELAKLLKFSGLAESGGQAKQMIVSGVVRVNGEVETRKGRKLHPGDVVRCGGETVELRTL